jgi:hypothetical protein
VVATENAVATQLIAKSALPRDEWAPKGDSAELNALLKFEKMTREAIEAARRKIVDRTDMITLPRAGPGE